MPQLILFMSSNKIVYAEIRLWHYTRGAMHAVMGRVIDRLRPNPGAAWPVNPYIFVIDNVNTHAGLYDAVKMLPEEERSHFVLWPNPTRSPQLNACEYYFAYLKHHLQVLFRRQGREFPRTNAGMRAAVKHVCLSTPREVLQKLSMVVEEQWLRCRNCINLDGLHVTVRNHQKSEAETYKRVRSHPRVRSRTQGCRRSWIHTVLLYMCLTGKCLIFQSGSRWSA